MSLHTIRLSDVLVSGRHGATTIEQETTQPFSVSVECSYDPTRALASDRLADAIDYYDLSNCIQQEVEHHSYTLLETLVQRVGDALARQFPVVSLDLSIQKKHIALQPRISARSHYFSERAVPDIRSFESIHDDLVRVGIASTPFLTDAERASLRLMAEGQEYIRQPVAPEGSLVREELSYCTVEKESEPFRAIADRVARFLVELQAATGAALFDEPLTEKEVCLQKYDAGSLGITPHRDEKSNRAVVVIIPLKGSATLAVCDDRVGTNPIAVDTTPGNLILLRAPGYRGMSVRPMHFVTDITDERIVLGVRFPKMK